MINLVEINRKNYYPFMDMKVYEHQRDQVASNAISMVQGNYHEEAWFRGICFEETPVGFIMLSLQHEKKEYWIWRFMVAKEHQGKGYGKAAIQKAVEFFMTIPDAEEVKLSFVPKEKGGAKGFYEKLGFQETGKVDEKSGEVEMSRKLVRK